MFSKSVTFTIVVTLSLVVCFIIQINGCKLYCLECPSALNATKSKYYCCMEDWQKAPIVRYCDYNSTASPITPTPTPCPTLQTPEPSRCPYPEIKSDKECEVYRRFSPAPCMSDKDCVYPFNVCCEDGCFNSTRICKTFRDEFKP